MRTERIIEVNAPGRTKQALKRPREAGGALEFMQELGVKPPVYVLKLASALLGGFNQDMETAVAARL